MNACEIIEMDGDKYAVESLHYWAGSCEITLRELILPKMPLNSAREQVLRKAVRDIIEEMADVQIMLDQMKLIFGDTRDAEEKKLSRLADRLN